MPALNFDLRFAKAVASGKKTQTIRKVRKRPIKTGDRLILLTGHRTEECRQLGSARCVYVAEVEVHENFLRVNGSILSVEDALCFAKKDGFRTVKAFRKWFRDHYGLPFFGVLIVWQFDQQFEK